MAQAMIANAYGKAKAARFRARFSLTDDGFTASVDPDYLDAHDYLHTVLGALPVWDDELKVLDLEQQVLDGRVHLKGLVTI